MHPIMSNFDTVELDRNGKSIMFQSLPSTLDVGYFRILHIQEPSRSSLCLLTRRRGPRLISSGVSCQINILYVSMSNIALTV